MPFPMKQNPRITPKDRKAIKGSLRRAFSRSELHKKVIEAALIKHSDPDRPRVKQWFRCNICGKPDARSYAVVDHIDPLVPIGQKFEDMDLNVVIDRLWCVENNLQAVDEVCHKIKSKAEKDQRKALK